MANLQRENMILQFTSSCKLHFRPHVIGILTALCRSFVLGQQCLLGCDVVSSALPQSMS
jgi:hypothetical protein